MAKQVLNPDQYPLFTPPMTWAPPASLPVNLINEPYFALDTETKDPDLNLLGPSWFRGGGEIVGISLAWKGGSCYLPIAHAGGGNLDGITVLAWLKDLLWNYKGILVLMNGFYDIGWCRAMGVLIGPNVTLHDVMMAAALLDEHRLKYNLASLAKTYNLPPKDETLLREAAITYGCDPKSELWRLPAGYVGPYAERDAVLTLEIYLRQLPLIRQQGLEKVVELEHDLVPLLMEMRWRGVRVDVDGAQQQLEKFNIEYEEHRAQIKTLTGYLPDVWSADSCAVACDKAGLRFNKTTTGKPSFTDDWLAGHEHAVPQLISRSRKAYKAGQTFCKGMILDYADRNGRIHAEFNPLRSDEGGTISGRFSSSSPNLQQVPVHEPRMNTLIRGLFLPEEDERWAAIDYKQQEPRLTVHYAFVRGCQRADVAVRRYNEDPNTDYHSLVAEMVFGSGFTPDDRKRAKTINLGLAYGMGGGKLCRSLGLSTVMKVNSYSGREYEAAGPEGQAILDRYHSEVPFIRELSKHYGDIALSDGQIRTLSGRLCRFPFFEPQKGGRALMLDEALSTYGVGNIKRAFTHTSLNRKIQGGAADMIKIAMRNMWREKIVPLVTVHDEVGASVGSPTEARQIAEIMSACVKLQVPLNVDIDLGASWGAAKPLLEEDV